MIQAIQMGKEIFLSKNSYFRTQNHFVDIVKCDQKSSFFCQIVTSSIIRITLDFEYL